MKRNLLLLILPFFVCCAFAENNGKVTILVDKTQKAVQLQNSEKSLVLYAEQFPQSKGLPAKSFDGISGLPNNLSANSIVLSGFSSVSLKGINPQQFGTVVIAFANIGQTQLSDYLSRGFQALIFQSCTFREMSISLESKTEMSYLEITNCGLSTLPKLSLKAKIVNLSFNSIQKIAGSEWETYASIPEVFLIGNPIKQVPGNNVKFLGDLSTMLSLLPKEYAAFAQ